MSIYKETTGQGEDVVILHGTGCDHRHTQPVVEALANRYRVTNFDLPGRGQSSWRADTKTIHGIADQLLADLPEQAIYIGWSFGGLVSTSIAARYPGRVKRFIGITTVPKFIADNDWIGVPQPGFQAAFSPIKEYGFKTFLKENFFDVEFAEFNPKPRAYHELIAMLETSQPVDLDVLLKYMQICDATDLREEVKSLQIPIDLILTDKDDAVPAASFEQTKALNPRINMHILHNVHHMPFWTHPDEFNKILNNILK